jgi:glycosyltransferase involved in cell wall biosynthesis
VAILLSTYEGERFLVPQLHSLLSQTHRDWVLYWRDDGSTDGTRQVMRDFLQRIGPERSVVLEENMRGGATESYMRLLRRAYADGNPVLAFADQDDVWLPEKLSRGIFALTAVPDEVPALYFARQVLVDASLRHIALSPRVRRAPGFPTCLTQNLATGCTVLMNREAMALLAGRPAPAEGLHDWWSYIVVAAHGGRLIADNEPTVLYRQHDSNTVGAPRSPFRRAIAALRRGPEPFMRLLRGYTRALGGRMAELPEGTREALARIQWGLEGGVGRRLNVLRMPGFRRQTWLETLLFRVWFLLK